MSAATPAPKRLVTLLATDIVGSVGLKRRLGHDRAARLIETHDEATKEVVGRYAGAEVLVDTGDGFIISFPTPEQAVEAALALLVELRDRLGEGSGLEVRAGIHIGEIRWLEAGEGATGKVFGMAVDSACRLMDLAGPNQVLTSRLVQEEASLATIAPPEGHAVEWALHGRYVLRGLGSSRQVYEVGLAGISPLSPPPDSPAGRRATEVSNRRHWAVVVGLAAIVLTSVWLLIGQAPPAAADDAASTDMQVVYRDAIAQAAIAVRDGQGDKAREVLLGVPGDLRGWEWGFLFRGSGQPQVCGPRAAKVEVDPGGLLVHAALASEGRYLITTSMTPLWFGEAAAEGMDTVGPEGEGPYHVGVWDAVTGALFRPLPTAEGGIKGVVGGNLDRLLVVLQSGSMEIWDLVGWRRVATLGVMADPSASAIASLHGRGLEPLAGFAGSRVWAVLGDGSLGIWEATDGRPVAAVGRRGVEVVGASFSRDGTKAALAYADGTIQMLGISPGEQGPEPFGQWQETGGPGLRVSISPEGERVVTWSYRQENAPEVLLRRAADGAVLATLLPAGAQTTSVQFAARGDRILITARDMDPRVVAGSEGALLTILAVPGRYVVASAISPDGTRVATVSMPEEGHESVGYRIALWDSAWGNSRLLDLEAHADMVRSVAFSPSGGHLATASFDGTARVWSTCFPNSP
ncbi:hypothetical protein IIA16_01190 [bacterium]|nr:hypothetical protein [bacterium]